MHIWVCFCYVRRLTIPHREAAFGCLHNGGRAAFGRPPTVVKTIMGDGEVANIPKT